MAKTRISLAIVLRQLKSIVNGTMHRTFPIGITLQLNFAMASILALYASSRAFTASASLSGASTDSHCDVTTGG